MTERSDSLDEVPNLEGGLARPLLESEIFPYFRQRSKQESYASKYLIALLISNSIWIVLFWYYLHIERATPCPRCKTASATDFSSIVPFLSPPKTTVFDDQLRYNSTTHEFWRDLNSSVSQYFGPPSPEIDSAWAELLRGEFMGVSSQEISLNPDLHFEDQDLNPFTGHYHIAIDVVHSLHCLNAVRKQLDRDYYFPSQVMLDTDGDVTGPPESTTSRSDLSGKRMKGHHELWSKASQREHIDHCLNHVRQSLQCHPDLSPAAMKKHVSNSGDTFYLGNAEKHTCVDWTEIEKWIYTRRTSELGAWDE